MQFTHRDLVDIRIKRLEMIQSIIARVAGNSATTKTVCISAITAICGLAFTTKMPFILLVGLLAVCLFAFVDFRQLQVEKRYRQFHKAICDKPWDSEPSLSVDIHEAPEVRWHEVITSWSVSVFYGALFAVELILFVLLLGLRGYHVG